MLVIGSLILKLHVGDTDALMIVIFGSFFAPPTKYQNSVGVQREISLPNKFCRIH